MTNLAAAAFLVRELMEQQLRPQRHPAAPAQNSPVPGRAPRPRHEPAHTANVSGTAVSARGSA